MKKKTLRIGIIGCGGMGRNAHINGFYAHEPRVKLVAACDILEGFYKSAKLGREVRI